MARHRLSERLLTTLGVSLLVSLAYLRLRSGGRRRKGEPPLEVGIIPFVGVGFEFVSDFQGLMTRLGMKHGRVFTIYAFGARMTFITDIIGIRKMWTLPRLFDFEEFGIKADANLAGLSYTEVAASGVASAHLALHAKEMRTPERLEELAARFREALGSVHQLSMFECAATGEWTSCELMDLCGPLVWVAGGKSLFGRPWCEGVDLLVSYRWFATFAEQAPAMIGGLPGYLTRDGRKARDTLAERVVVPVIAALLACKDDSVAAHPYLIPYIKALYEAHGKDVNKVARRLMGVLFAIFANTIGLLYWTVARLYTISKEERRQIQDEVTSQLADISRSYADVSRGMPLFNSFLMETLRMHSDPNSFRVVAEDCVVGLGGAEEFAFRKGDQIFGLSSFDQMSSGVDVKDPAAFEAFRWLKYTSDMEMNHKLLPLPAEQVLVPFGGGKHLCPGRYFAKLEMQLAIAWTIANFDFEIPAESTLPAKVVELSAVINMPKAPFLVRFRSRH